MKFKFSRSTGTVDERAKQKRAGRSTTPRALDSDRPTRFYSLLLPPPGNGTRR
jgi:hypothetical protein